MKANVKNGIRYENIIEDGNIKRIGRNRNGDIVYLQNHKGEVKFEPVSGDIIYLKSDNEIFEFSESHENENAKCIYLRNIKDENDIFILLRPTSYEVKTNWMIYHHTKNNKTLYKIEEFWPNTFAPAKATDYECGCTTIYFKNGKKHIVTMNGETTIYDYNEDRVYSVKNGVITKYKKDNSIRYTMHEENNHRIYTYPALCNKADIVCDMYPSGLKYYYRNNKLVMKKHARGTIYMFYKEKKKNTIKHKIMVDGTKIFCNQRGNPKYEITPKGEIFYYRSGRRINNPRKKD